MRAAFSLGDGLISRGDDRDGMSTGFFQLSFGIFLKGYPIDNFIFIQ